MVSVTGYALLRFVVVVLVVVHVLRTGLMDTVLADALAGALVSACNRRGSSRVATCHRAEPDRRI
ncbi:hypothetical protein AB0G02_19450 [Actinosynnema sp. NPDC023658]|uniref:hypothetical protein n=1 Tax=Actinosynnema sp. NPDC023658 TaxID=3155465 RepID=UPI0033F0ADB0